MANPLYSMLTGGGGMMPQAQPARPVQAPVYSNPFQQLGQVMAAMRNPQAFVRQMIPDLPPEIANDPNRILGWLKQNRGITDAQIQQAAGMIPMR